MPVTPFHLGPGGCVCLPLRKYIDVPAFLLVNFVIDLEPLLVMALDLDYPIHGYIHTFLFGGLTGVLFGVAAFYFRGLLEWLMRLVSIPYTARFGRIVLSSVLGIWLHIILDSILHADIRPFYPYQANPFYGLLGGPALYAICSLAFIPAFLLYLRARKANKPQT